MTEKRYESLVAVLRNKKNIILQGAPGVGKTFGRKTPGVVHDGGKG